MMLVKFQYFLVCILTVIHVFDILIFVLSLDIYIIADEEDNQHALKLHRLVPSIVQKR